MKLTKKQPVITKEWILSKVTEYDIYRSFFGDFQLNRITKNHLRGESRASFIIGTKFGHITHVDFVDTYWKGDCFALVQQMYKIGFAEALETIAVRFGLIHGEEPKKITWKQPEIVEIRPTLIQVVSRKFNKTELDYWAGFHQGVEDLKRENIYAIREAYIDRRRARVYEKNLSFAYYYPEKEQYKLYCPEDPQIDGVSWKWRTNCDFDYIEWLDEIGNCVYAFVAKSKKDRMVMRSALETDCLITTQSENPACFTDEVIAHLRANSQYQVSCYDTDAPGKRASMYLTEHFGFKHCNVPDKYLKEGIKDFAELGKVYGLETVRNHFKKKNYI